MHTALYTKPEVHTKTGCLCQYAQENEYTYSINFLQTRHALRKIEVQQKNETNLHVGNRTKHAGVREVCSDVILSAY